MSQSGYVLSNRILLTQSQWQETIVGLGFDLVLHSADDIQTRHGHLQATWQNREAGFECGPANLTRIVETYCKIDLRGPWTYAYAFYWSTLAGCAGAWIAMTAYAEATDGVVFDPQEGDVLSSTSAAKEARETERNFPRFQAMFER